MAERLEPALNKARATAALTPPARQLHQWVLTVFIDTGHAPSRADLERMTRDQGVDLGVDLDAALSELTGRDVLAVNEQGEIRAAYPFSPAPTRHRVTWDGGTSVHAMCAIDALGMSAMLSVPVTVTSTEPDTNHEVTVRVDHHTARWNPTTAVVFAGTTAGACCPSADRTCGHINFFTTADAARDWATRNPDVTGVVLNQAQALGCGIAEFGTFLRPLDQPAGEDIGR
jgi:alkylmercury lyase-like protein